MSDEREGAATYGRISIAVARLVRAIAEAGLPVEKELSILEHRYKRRETGRIPVVRMELVEQQKVVDPRRDPED